eukprot:8105951-Alexandrium_andersonii.AAC.1
MPDLRTRGHIEQDAPGEGRPRGAACAGQARLWLDCSSTAANCRHAAVIGGRTAVGLQSICSQVAV